MTAIDDLKAEVIRLAHPAANVFPLMSDDELQGLAEDIKANGLREPLCKDDGLIVDGRNRWIACQVAGVEAKALALPSDIGVVAYIVSHNLKRRHLDASQRAAIAAELASAPWGRNQHRTAPHAQGGGEERPIVPSSEIPTREEAAALLNVSVKQIQRARAVRAADPVVFEQVKRGEKSVFAAMKEIGKPVQRRAKPEPDKPKARSVAHSGKPNLRVVETAETPDHIARLRLWLTSGARLAGEITDPATEWADYGHLLSLDDIDEILNFVAALSAATKAVRAA